MSTVTTEERTTTCKNGWHTNKFLWPGCSTETCVALFCFCFCLWLWPLLKLKNFMQNSF